MNNKFSDKDRFDLITRLEKFYLNKLSQFKLPECSTVRKLFTDTAGKLFCILGGDLWHGVQRKMLTALEPYKNCTEIIIAVKSCENVRVYQGSMKPMIDRYENLGKPNKFDQVGFEILLSQDHATIKKIPELCLKEIFSYVHVNQTTKIDQNKETFKATTSSVKSFSKPNEHPLIIVLDQLINSNDCGFSKQTLPEESKGISSAVSPELIVEKFANLKMWQKGDERAPNKPLLLLLALGECFNNKKRLLPFVEVAPRLTCLLENFGPPRRAVKPEYPFWRLTGDKIWEIPNQSEVKVNGSGDPSKNDLINQQIAGGFTEEIFRCLLEDKKLIQKLATALLEDNFPESYHEDILLSVGLNFSDNKLSGQFGKRRDPDFRNRILSIYQYKCAVCGFDLRLGNNPVCLEAAHIKWHQAGGPSTEQNGLALCSMHHKMFDRGVFTLDNSMTIKVSILANGSRGLQEWLMRFEKQKVFLPSSSLFRPEEAFVDWHFREVFKDYKPTFS